MQMETQWTATMAAEDKPAGVCRCGAPILTGNKRARLCRACWEAAQVRKAEMRKANGVEKLPPPQKRQKLQADLERTRLGELEAVIDRGLKTFIEVGRALTEIRDRRLYRHATFRERANPIKRPSGDWVTIPAGPGCTFEQYAERRFGIGKSHAYRLIEAAEVVAVVSPIGDTPTNEAQARELVSLMPNETAVREVWCEVVKSGKVTAGRVRRAVNRRLRVEAGLQSDDDEADPAAATLVEAERVEADLKLALLPPALNAALLEGCPLTGDVPSRVVVDLDVLLRVLDLAALIASSDVV
jgi:hypothetical protein